VNECLAFKWSTSNGVCCCVGTASSIASRLPKQVNK
jgi:hypothetical protein